MNEEIRQALSGGTADRPPPTEPVRVAEHGGWLAVITIDSGTRHNAMSAAAWTRLAEVATSLRWEDHARVVVVRGGRSAFSAGADISEFPARRQSAQDAAGYNARVSAALRALMELPMPVVAMVSGDAVGGGCEIAAACDVRIAADSARLGLPLARLGVVQGPVEQQAVLRLIGPARLKWLVFSGRLLDAAQAHRIGLVDEVVPEDELVDAVGALVASVGSASEASCRATKYLVDHRRADAVTTEEELTAHFLRVYDGPELKDGVAAFLRRSTTPRP